MPSNHYNKAQREIHFIYVMDDLITSDDVQEETSLNEQLKTVMMIEQIEPESTGEKVEWETLSRLGSIGNPIKVEHRKDGRLYSYKASNPHQSAFSYVVQPPGENSWIRYTMVQQKESFTLTPFKKMLNSVPQKFVDGKIKRA